MGNSITKLFKGLSRETTSQNQLQGTYGFALNAINESREGNLTEIGNEESNKLCASLPTGYIPIGKAYMNNGDYALFSVNPALNLSEIGILKNNCVYESHVNFNLNFQVTNQIDVTYRLRRGCERTVYWVDGDANKPRIYNFDKPDDFKTAGSWDADKFNLFKTYSQIPTFADVEIEELGNLLPGSYNASIRYLDGDLNPTEFITTSEPIIIYNDAYSKNFSAIEGSTNEENDYQNFGKTNKSIKFTFDNLDPDFSFYQVAIIEANTGSGNVSRVVYSSVIPTTITTYSYTGSNAETVGTEEEVQLFNDVVDRAEHIDQIENRLILAKTKGKQVNFCGLQQYASKIKADLITKEVLLNVIDADGNQKRGTALQEGIGYMPGEMYSFAAVYVLGDGTVTPGYHIPGRNSSYVSQMSDDNELQNTVYTAEDCGNTNYWGRDSEGDDLKGEKVRHHRFPLRSDVGEPLITSVSDVTSTDLNTLTIDVSGTIGGGYTNDEIVLRVSYEIDGVPSTFDTTINVSTYNPTVGLSIQVVSTANNLIFVSAIEILSNGSPDPSPSGLVYTPTISVETVDVENTLYSTNIFGIKFSNIELPDPSVTNGEEVIGYYIVRHERTTDQKTIVDTGVITPLCEEPFYVSHSHLAPERTANRLKNDMFSIIHPEHRFFGNEYRNVSSIIQEGVYNRTMKLFRSTVTEDVMPGTSYDPEVSKKREADADGFDLKTLTRDSRVEYSATAASVFAEAGVSLDEVFYLDALHSRPVQDASGLNKEVFNVSSDNKIGIVKLNQNKTNAEVESIAAANYPYVVLKRDLSDPYANFRVLPYYKDTQNFQRFNTSIEEVDVFSGDSYVCPMRYTTTFYYDTRLRERDSKSGIWNIVLGVLSVVAGALIAVGTFGAGTAAALMAIGFGVNQIATGIKKEQLASVYQEAYEAGLKDTVDDDLTNQFFGPNPEDDQVQWMSDIVTNLWFETTANTNWRKGSTVGITDFYPAPTSPLTSMIAEANNTVSKLTKLDTEAGNGRLYQGFANAEIYEINADYLRGNKQKIFFHLPFEYDCCSECLEDFSHRVKYSQQSFQEELSDNYRSFLPNNYKDIEGETGKITDIFRIQNNLYIHTEEALWHLPQNIQERVTGDIVAFIGTGDFFSIPPRKVVDDGTGNSAGTDHKWSKVKTPYGVMFISEAQSTIFQFDGNKLEPISNTGLYNYFKENLRIETDYEYEQTNGVVYPYKNNPSNPIGTGFVATYDSRHERYIFTKKDFLLNQEVINSDDYRIIYCNNEPIIFRDYNQTLAQREIDGWNFQGIEDCKLKFTKLSLKFDPDLDQQEIVEFEEGEVIENLFSGICSYTMSYSIKTGAWIGWHSYLPAFYLHSPDRFYSWLEGQEGIWEHGVEGNFQNFYGTKYPFIIEYTSASDQLLTKYWDYITLQTEARRYVPALDEYVDERFITFNKGIFYNTRQCTGLLNIKSKDETLDEEYLMDQVKNVIGEIIADRNERDWTINDLRDFRIDYEVPIFDSSKEAVQADYYIDKVLNSSSIDHEKDWTQLEALRDKYLVIRLIFDKFDDVKLVLNYSVEHENPSSR